MKCVVRERTAELQTFCSLSRMLIKKSHVDQHCIFLYLYTYTLYT